MSEWALFIPANGRGFLGRAREPNPKDPEQGPMGKVLGWHEDTVTMERAISPVGLQALGGERENVFFRRQPEQYEHPEHGLIPVYREMEPRHINEYIDRKTSLDKRIDVERSPRWSE